MVCRVFWDTREYKDYLAQKAKRVMKEFKECRDCLVVMVIQASLVDPVQLVLLERMEERGHKAFQESLVVQENSGQRDVKVLQECMVQLVNLGSLDPQVHMGGMARQDHVVPRAIVVYLVAVDYLDILETWVSQVFLDYLGIEAKEGVWVLQVFKGLGDLMDIEDKGELAVIVVSKEHLENQALRVTVVREGLWVILELLDR